MSLPPSSSSSQQRPNDYIFKYILVGDSGVGKSCLLLQFTDKRFAQTCDSTVGVEFGTRIVTIDTANECSSPEEMTRKYLLSSSSSSSPQQHNNNNNTTTTNSSKDADDDHTRQQQQQQHLQLTRSMTQVNSSFLMSSAHSQSMLPPEHTIKFQVWDTAGQEAFRSITRAYYRGACCALLVFDVCQRATFEHVTGWLNDIRQNSNLDVTILLIGNKCDLRPTPLPLPAEDGSPSNYVSSAEAVAWAAEHDVAYMETSAKTAENVDEAFFDTARAVLKKITSGALEADAMRGKSINQSGRNSGPGMKSVGHINKGESGKKFDPKKLKAKCCK